MKWGSNHERRTTKPTKRFAKFSREMPMKTIAFLIAAMVATNIVMTAAHADGFMDYETERARTTEANGECEISIPLGADKQACVSAYLCSNYGDCDGEGMRPIEQLPGGGIYRDNVGGGSNGN